MVVVRHVTRLLAVAAVAATVGGCASYAWEKPGATEDVAARDSSECSLEARRVAADYDWLAWSHRPWPGEVWHHPFAYSRDPFIWGPEPDPSLQWDLERDAFSRCMEVKGYELVKQPRS